MNSIQKKLKKYTKNIVLGHPFSGALYAYFDKELNQGRHTESAAWHTYYKTLYGKHYESNLDLTLALSLIFENVIVPAADNPFPDYDKYSVNGEYYHPDFGLYFTWLDDANFRHIVDEKIKRVLSDKVIVELLKTIPSRVHEQIINEIFYELSMAAEFDCPLFTLGKRQALANRIFEIEEQEAQLSDTTKIKIVSNYLEISGLLFQPLSIDSFCYLKSEKQMRQYADSFISLLDEAPKWDKSTSRDSFLRLMKEAMERDKLSKKVAGAFEVGSNATTYLGLIPGIGTVTGIAGIGSDLAAKGIKKLNNNVWYELASHVEKLRSIERLNAALKGIK